MRKGAIERRIRALQGRIVAARAELDVLDEQIEALADDAEEFRVRSLVSETPLSERASADARRHLELAQRAADSLRDEIARCTVDRDRLLGDLPVATGR